eukprot:TRINITY_DN1795_c0_g1_i2.p1 TRINITY_DN1795_c0_g1~~TRINITY_DN1795_c0_g1_i2.p1  ORF type:complete len:318 (-),score=46.23 TRINITY_DN1795_c0_g1_i2:120-1073(-)
MESFNVVVEFFEEHKLLFISNGVTLIAGILVAIIFRSKGEKKLRAILNQLRNLHKTREYLEEKIQSSYKTRKAISFLRAILIFAFIAVLTSGLYLVFLQKTYNFKQLFLLNETRITIFSIIAAFIFLYLLLFLNERQLYSKENRLASLGSDQDQLAADLLKTLGEAPCKVLREFFNSGESIVNANLEYLQQKEARLDFQANLLSEEVTVVTELVQQVLDFEWCSNCLEASRLNEVNTEGQWNVRKLSCSQRCLLRYYDMSRVVGHRFNDYRKEVEQEVEKLNEMTSEEQEKKEEYERVIKENRESLSRRGSFRNLPR